MKGRRGGEGEGGGGEGGGGEGGGPAWVWGSDIERSSSQTAEPN